MADEEIKHFISNRFGSKGLSDAIDPEQSPVRTNPEPEMFEQSIDLRTIYPYSCSPYYHKDRVHYLDKDTIEYFQRLLDRNNGNYTERIYNSVMKYATANMPYIPDEEENEANKSPIVIPAGYSQNRQESRLNFATDVEIEMPSGALLMARSVDISASGIQLKVKQLVDIINDMELELSFPQLEEKEEQRFGQVTYILKKHEIGSLYMSLFLVRKDPGEAPFDLFIESFIQAKKHRYRIDSEDSSLALVSKAWEYLYIKSLPYLACFISSARERIQIQEVCLSESNTLQIKGLGQAMLSHLESNLSTFRINGIATNEVLSPEIFAFRYQGDGMRYRLCASSWQFKDGAERLNFIRAGIDEESFVAWRIEIVKLEDLPKARSRELLARLFKESDAQADNLISLLNEYDYMMYLVDITEHMKKDPLLADDVSHTPLADHFLDDFALKHARTSDFTRLRLGISKRRNEQRYIYKSPVVLKLYGKKYKGNTIDFSTNGLKVETDRPRDFQIRDTVYLEFTGFNKKFRTAKLKSEPYRVVAITPDESICLCRDHRVSQHKAAIFLRKLINQNVEVLKHCTGELWMSTKARLIEAWMHQCLPTQSLLVSRKNNQYYIPYIIQSDTTRELLAPFAMGEGLYDFRNLFERTELTSLFRHLVVEQAHTMSLEFYVSKVSPTAKGIKVKLWSDFTSDLERAEYLRNQFKLDTFAAYSVSLSKIPKLDKSDLREDMNVIRRNSRHRLIEFEETYKSLVGVVELTNINQQVKARYNLDSSL